MRASSPVIFFILTSLALFGPLAVPAQATSFTWTGLGDSRNWDDPDNWSGGTGYPGASPFFHDTVLFPVLSQSYTVDLNDGAFPYLSGITFATPGYSLIIGSTDLVANGGITATVANAPDFEVDGVLLIGGPSTINNLTGSGFVTTTLNSSTLTQVGAAGNFTGFIADSGGTAITSLTVGDGTQTASLILNPDSDGPNSYTGTTLVKTNATLVSGAAGALAADSDHVIDGTLSLSGGSAAVKSLEGTGTVNLAANTLTINGGGTSFDGTIGGTGGSLNLAGAGTLTLTGSNTYTGGTTVSAGTLKVNNTSGSGTGSGAVDVKSGATIGGGNGAEFSGTLTTLGTGSFTPTLKTYTANNVGIIGGALTIESGAHLAPGNSVGTLTTASLTLDSGSILDYEFNDTGNDFTSVTTSGGLTLNGGAFNLYQENTTTAFAQAGTYDLFGYSGVLNGSVANLSVLNPTSGFTYNFINDSTDDLIQLDIGAVPEPSTWFLLPLGFLLAYGAYRRGKRERLPFR